MGSFSANLISSSSSPLDDTQQQQLNPNSKYHEEQAKVFLNQQHDRITRIEEDLLKATEDLLPISSTSSSPCIMTVTELLGVCTALQQTNVKLMKQLDHKTSRQYSGNYTSVLTEERCHACMAMAVVNDEQDEPLSSNAPSFRTPWQFSTTSLEQVVETDNETDTTTTPGSSIFVSPPLSLRLSDDDSKGHSSGGTTTTTTPVTPSLDNLHLRYAYWVLPPCVYNLVR